MKILRKKLFSILPAWLILILLLGSVAAAFVWISNRISMNVYVYERPIFLEAVPLYSPMVCYVDEYRQHQINFTVNNPAQDEGYIYFNFTMMDPSDQWPSADVIYLQTRVHWDPSLYEYGIITSGYPKLANGNRTLEILVEHYNDTYMMADGPFNFSMYNTEGYIMYWLYYDNIVPGHSLEIQITDRL